MRTLMLAACRITHRARPVIGIAFGVVVLAVASPARSAEAGAGAPDPAPSEGVSRRGREAPGPAFATEERTALPIVGGPPEWTGPAALDAPSAPPVASEPSPCALPADGRWRAYPHGVPFGPPGFFDPARDRFVVLEPDGAEAQVLHLDSHGPVWRYECVEGPAPPSPSTYALDLEHDRALFLARDPASSANVLVLQLWELRISPRFVWRRLDASGMPSDLRYFPYGVQMVVDSRRDRLLVFQSIDHSRRLESVSLLSPAGFVPVTRYVYAFASSGEQIVLDPVGDRVVLFGGYYWQYHHQVVWEAYLNSAATLRLDVEAPSWEEIGAPGPDPPGSVGATLVFDPQGQRLLLAGGHNDGTRTTREVWQLSLGSAPQWTLLSGTEFPCERFGGRPGGFDTRTGELLLYSNHPFDEVWAFHPGTRAWRALAARQRMDARYQSALTVLDTRRARLVQHGGTPYESMASTVAVTAPRAGDVHTEPLPSGPDRHLQAGAYDEAADRLVILTGLTRNSVPQSDVWELPLASSAGWSAIPTTGDAPEPRGESAVVFDPVGRRFILHGGVVRRGITWTAVHDTWCLELDPEPRWRLLVPVDASPVRLESALAVYDPDRHRMLLVGSEVWELLLGTEPAWRRLDVAGTPPPSPMTGGAVYDEVRDCVVVHEKAGTYELSLSAALAWRQLHPSGAAPWDSDFVSETTPVHDALADHLLLASRSRLWSLERGQPLRRVTIDLLSGGPGDHRGAPSHAPVRVRLNGSAGFDVHTVDEQSLRLAGATPVPLAAGLDRSRFDDRNRDGYPDLLLQFDPEAVSSILSRGAPLVLRGVTSDAHRFRARQPMSIRGRVEDAHAGMSEPAPPLADRPTLRASGLAGRLRIELSGAVRGPATVECFDVLGRRLASRFVSDTGGGVYVLEPAESAGWDPGLVFVRLRSGGVTQTIRVVLL